MKCDPCILALLAATAAQACQHDIAHHDRFVGLESRLAKRQDAVAFPPVLEGNEAILSNSFDNASLETWSYYYTHGLHWAGTNKSMAQWTADRWNENGFDASLVQYCKFAKTMVTRHDKADLHRHLPELPTVEVCDHDLRQWHGLSPNTC